MVIQLLRAGTDSWQIHLQAASTIISPLVAAAKNEFVPSMSFELSPSEPSSNFITSNTMVSLLHPSRTTSVWSVERNLKNSLPSIDEIARDFLVGTFVWLDILASASTRSQPFLSEHLSYLNVCCSGSVIELDKLMGCENWVMISIASISELENRKRDNELAKHRNEDQSYRYSKTKVHERSKEIEMALNNGLEMNEQSLNRHHELTSSAPSSLGKLSRTDILHITGVFAHSALIYLHVVFLGANPNIPQVSTRVSRSISSFKDLSDLKLLKNMIWPLCVAGCMAQSDKKGFFRELIEKVDFETTHPGNIWKAYEIMKECWRLRANNDCDVDWTKAMQSMGLQILLV